MMEDDPVKSVKSAARRAGLLSAAAVSALALASCSAGHITQTSEQVAAVDGSSADGADGAVAVRDVTLTVDENSAAALKFTAINQDPHRADHRLQSVAVNGKPVNVPAQTLKPNCAVVGASAAALATIPRDTGAGCTEYVTTMLNNEAFAPAGTVNVTFTFDNATIDVPAAVSGGHVKSGTFTRDFDKDEHAAGH